MQVNAAGTYVFAYSAKFVCGYQPQLTGNAVGESVVKPGNYATDINIHNSNFRAITLKKSVIVLVDPQNGPIGREPNFQQPKASVKLDMPAAAAMFDDCNAIWNMLYPAGAAIPTPMPLLVGFLTVLSPVDLTIDAVYTASVPGTQQATPTGISIDVNRVNGKRIFAPTAVFP